MQKVVIDTNIIISAAISDRGNPAKIMDLISDRKLQMYYSEEIFVEYTEVLSRARFKFSLYKQEVILEKIKEIGTIIKPAVSEIEMPDETDRKFYDAARNINAYLITGNIKHYPSEPLIMTPALFLTLIEN